MCAWCVSMFLLHSISHIEKANEASAIEVLMVTDELFRYILCCSYIVRVH